MNNDHVRDLNFVFQPIYKNNKIVFAEALIRPNKGTIESFLNSITNTVGFDIELIRCVLNQTRTIKAKVPITINIHSTSIGNEEFVNFCCRNLKNKEHYLEMTESHRVDLVNTIKENIAKLRRSGVKIAVDDYGKGHSDYNLVSYIKPDLVKIDGSMISNISTNNSAYKYLIETCIKLNKIGCKDIVFEHVENASQYKLIQSFYPESIIQGFYHTKPINIEDLNKLIQQNNMDATTKPKTAHN